MKTFLSFARLGVFFSFITWTCAIASERNISPCCCGWGNFLVTADYVLWKVKEEGLTYAVNGIGTSTGPHSGETRDPNWKWHSGYKLGVGYQVPCTNWDLYVNYTSFRSHAFDEIDVLGYFSTYFMLPSITGALAPGSFADWHLRYRTVDIELGYSLPISCSFSLNPYGGIRVAWTKEIYELFSDRSMEITVITQDMILTQKFKGVGPRAGFELDWFLCKNLKLFADSSFALLWGNYRVVNSEFTESMTLPSTSSIIHDHFASLKALVDMKLGVGWNFRFCNRFNASFLVAWEHRLWLKYNQFLRFTQTTISQGGISFKNDTDLALYGLTFRGQIEF